MPMAGRIESTRRMVGAGSGDHLAQVIGEVPQRPSHQPWRQVGGGEVDHGAAVHAQPRAAAGPFARPALRVVDHGSDAELQQLVDHPGAGRALAGAARRVQQGRSARLQHPEQERIGRVVADVGQRPPLSGARSGREPARQAASRHPEGASPCRRCWPCRPRGLASAWVISPPSPAPRASPGWRAPTRGAGRRPGGHPGSPGAVLATDRAGHHEMTVTRIGAVQGSRVKLGAFGHVEQRATPPGVDEVAEAMPQVRVVEITGSPAVLPSTALAMGPAETRALSLVTAGRLSLPTGLCYFGQPPQTEGWRRGQGSRPRSGLGEGGEQPLRICRRRPYGQRPSRLDGRVHEPSVCARRSWHAAADRWRVGDTARLLPYPQPWRRCGSRRAARWPASAGSLLGPILAHGYSALCPRSVTTEWSVREHRSSSAWSSWTCWQSEQRTCNAHRPPMGWNIGDSQLAPRSRFLPLRAPGSGRGG